MVFSVLYGSPSSSASHPHFTVGFTCPSFAWFSKYLSPAFLPTLSLTLAFLTLSFPPLTPLPEPPNLLSCLPGFSHLHYPGNSSLPFPVLGSSVSWVPGLSVSFILLLLWLSTLPMHSLRKSERKLHFFLGPGWILTSAAQKRLCAFICTSRSPRTLQL